MVNSAYFVKATPLRAFNVSRLMHGRYVTDILKRWMKKFNAEKNIFDKLTGFWLDPPWLN